MFIETEIKEPPAEVEINLKFKSRKISFKDIDSDLKSGFLLVECEEEALILLPKQETDESDCLVMVKKDKDVYIDSKRNWINLVNE